MEKLRCPEHGCLCFLKTGTRDGPSQGKSFYICSANRSTPCPFTQPVGLPASHCLLHEEHMVDLQALVKQDSGDYRLYYRCTKSKSDGKKYCGNIPWQPEIKQKLSSRSELLLEKTDKPQRNPFKVLCEGPKPPSWEQIIADKTPKENASLKNQERNLSADEKRKISDRKPSQEDEQSGDRKSEERIYGHNKCEERKQVRDGRSDTEKMIRGDPERKKRSDERPNSEKMPGDNQILQHPEKRQSGDKKSDRERIPSNRKSDHEKSNPQGKSEQKGESGKSQLAETLQEKQNSGLSSVHKGGKVDGSPEEPPVTFQGWREKALPAGLKIKKKHSDVLQEIRHRDSSSGRNMHDPAGGGDTPDVRRSPDCHRGPAHQQNALRGDDCQSSDIRSPSAVSSIARSSSLCSDGGQGNSPLRISQEDDGTDSDDDDVVFVGSQPGKDKAATIRTSGGGKQTTIPSFPGFTAPSGTHNSVGIHSMLSVQLQQKKATLASVNVNALPDKGNRLRKQVQELEDALGSMSLDLESTQQRGSSQEVRAKVHSNPGNPFSKPAPAEVNRGVKPLAFHELPPSALAVPASAPSSGQNYNRLYGAPHWQSLYGGRMTEERLSAVRNATSETIDHLHKSLETCPSSDTTVEDPKGLKVPLLLHQKQALAWLLWRENQKPPGGILADDMGLGKTLTMVALILAQKHKQRGEEKNVETWICKTDSTLTASRGTLIICPASLLHHWEKEVDRRVSGGKLRVCLYHGPNRDRDCSLLAQYDIVVTTYNLVSKEIPAKKEEGEAPAQDQDLEDKKAFSPLLRIAWARIILDEAHNIKNPKVQTSIAVCKLRAGARWAVTGTPIQNNLLDLYSLLRFLRCSPFDEYKLWKSQVDNGSRKGGERLNILTKSLLLRRTKDQLDGTGKPLVALPHRSSKIHQLKLSEKEQSVYDVIFARSRSTLQSYLKRQEGGPLSSSGQTDNPFERVAREFGSGPSELPSPPASSTVHILSLLLRLRQCCCHLSLLRTTLEQQELKSEGLSLSLEEQLSALTLCDARTPDSGPTVSLNGATFSADLFEGERGSTKINSLVSELEALSCSAEPQKSVIVSQWTSMLKIVAVHLRRIGLSYANIDGSVSPKQRMDLVEEFNLNPRGPQVMLLSLCAGGVGLNLIGGNHLFLLDMHWNPALEEQACDRIYRVGQRRDVVTHRFVCEGTVEEKICQLQARKKELANKVLAGHGATFTKLTLADLRLLFGL